MPKPRIKLTREFVCWQKEFFLLVAVSFIEYMCSRSSVENHCFFMTIKFKLLTRFLKYSLGCRTRTEKKPPLSYSTGHPNNIQFIMTYSI